MQQLDAVQQASSSLRLQALILDVLLADCLDGMIRASWPFHLPPTSSPASSAGLSALIRKVSTALVERPGGHILDAADYLDGFTPTRCQHIISHPYRRCTTVSASEVYWRVLVILCEWLVLPDPSKVFPRAWFASEIISRIGVEALHLDFVQRGADHLNVEVLGIGRRRNVNRDAITDWFNENIDGLPITDQDSEEKKCLHRIASALEVHSFANTPLNIQLDSLPFVHAPPLDEPFPPIETLAALLPPRSYTPIEYQAPPKVDQIERLLRMVTALYPLIESLDATSTATDPHLRALHDAFLGDVKAFLDQRLPFRNLAPSRRKILEPSGPYSPLHSSTVPGFFSALVYRAITHSSPFLLDSGISFFPTLQQFQKCCKVTKTKTKEYFCNPAAYGRPHGRSMLNAPVYWTAANNNKINSWVTSTEPKNFLEAFRSIRLAKLPIYGLLTAAQLVIDYAECGKVTSPTFEEMGVLILQLKKGALSALNILGFEVASAQDAARALHSLHETLEAHIPEETQAKIDFGVIFIEHLLCKFKRLERLNSFVAYDLYLSK